MQLKIIRLCRDGAFPSLFSRSSTKHPDTINEFVLQKEVGVHVHTAWEGAGSAALPLKGALVVSLSAQKDDMVINKKKCCVDQMALKQSFFPTHNIRHSGALNGLSYLAHEGRNPAGEAALAYVSPVDI